VIKRISSISALTALGLIAGIVFFIQILEPRLGKQSFDIWSMRAAFFSILLTIIGFGITFFQLIKTSSAAEAAETAVLKLKSALASFDVSGQLREGRILAEQAKPRLLENKWQYGLANCERVRTILAGLSSSKRYLADSDFEEVKDHLATIQDACQNLESKITSPEFDLDVTVLNSRLRDIEVFFMNLESGIRDRAGGNS
jgi:hypothetical protein